MEYGKDVKQLFKKYLPISCLKIETATVNLMFSRYIHSGIQNEDLDLKITLLKLFLPSYTFISLPQGPFLGGAEIETNKR